MKSTLDFERLANRHKDAVYRQMVRVCGSHEDAEDALAEALLSAYKAADNLRSEEAFRGWLATIGRRACLRLRRRDLVAPILALNDLEVPADGSLEEEVELGRMKGCVNAAVTALPDIYRDTYVLREIEGRSAEEVAKELGLSIAAVKSRLHRARKLVREHLDQSLCTA
ncbi:MAG TPA: RNA polymerase sigma factor [Fimbriimonas sp.]